MAASHRPHRRNSSLPLQGEQSALVVAALLLLVHVIGGHVVGIAVAIHGLAHFTRWASQGNLAFLWTHVTGRSGVISLLLTPLIVLPMRWAKLRKQMRWELRKALHYLSIVWCFSICFHAPLQHIAWIMGVPLAIYLLDVGWSRPCNSASRIPQREDLATRGMCSSTCLGSPRASGMRSRYSATRPSPTILASA